MGAFMLSRKAWISANLAKGQFAALSRSVQDFDVDSCFEKVGNLRHGNKVACCQPSFTGSDFTAMRCPCRSSSPVQFEISFLQDILDMIISIMFLQIAYNQIELLFRRHRRHFFKTLLTKRLC